MANTFCSLKIHSAPSSSYTDKADNTHAVTRSPITTRSRTIARLRAFPVGLEAPQSRLTRPRRFRLGNNLPGVRKLLSQSDIGRHRKGIFSPESTRLEDRRIACPNCETGGKLNAFQRGEDLTITHPAFLVSASHLTTAPRKSKSKSPMS